MANRFTISREIGIDAGHRVMTHGSKCKNLHGHRYKIQATCSAKILIDAGEQTSMVIDFGFLKGLMMDYIDEPCDHGMIMFAGDPMLKKFFHDIRDLEQAQSEVSEYGQAQCNSIFGKLYIVGFIPTAEQLAKHWYYRLALKVEEVTHDVAKLESITVHETPNCQATYSGGSNGK